MRSRSATSFRALIGAIVAVVVCGPRMIAQTTTPPAGTPKTTPPAQTKPVAPTQTKPTPPAQAKTPPAAQVKTPPAAQVKTPPAAQTKAAPPKPVEQAPRGAAPPAGRGAAPGATPAKGDTMTALPIVIMRETFVYSSEGRRDPFLSLLTTTELRPTLSDLKLSHIFYSPPNGSVASIRDLFNKKPVTARVGTQFGRMRVEAIHPNAVVFSIDEFGTTRRDSLVVRPDTT